MERRLADFVVVKNSFNALGCDQCPVQTASPDAILENKLDPEMRRRFALPQVGSLVALRRTPSRSWTTRASRN